MCGGYEVDADPQALVEAFRVDHNQLLEPFAREHFPRMLGPIVLTRAASATQPPERWLGLARWGLVPHWAKELSVGDKLFNARAETLAQKPAFRDAFARRRCIVPVTAFYEWRKQGKRSERFVVRAESGAVLSLAGLWEIWRSPSGEKVGSYTVITVAPNRLIAAIHDRMPAVLDSEAVERWLSPDSHADQLAALLAPCAEGVLRAVPG